MLGVQFSLAGRIILVLLGLAILFIFISPAFGFDLMKYLTNPPSIEDITQVVDFSSADQYQNGELVPEGMSLLEGAGVDSVSEELHSNLSVAKCSGCSSCTNAFTLPKKFYKCQSCDTCNGITQAGRYNNCLNCDTTSGTCVMCDDTGDEYALCKNLKTCIYQSYGDKEYSDINGCLVGQIQHNEGDSIDLNELDTILKSCKSEMLTLNIGNNMTKDLCYFNNTSISNYDYERPNDFYLKYQVPDPGTSSTYPTLNGQVRFYPVYQDKELIPYFDNGGESAAKYRVYVAFNSTPNSKFEVRVGHFQYIVAPNLNWDNKECPLGEVTTDSNGFAKAMLTYGTDCNKDGENWKDYPEKHPLNGIAIFSPTQNSNEIDSIKNVNVVFYSNNPYMNGQWADDLRYSNCNFNVPIDSYLEDRPWWGINNPDNLNTSWSLTQGDKDSSIKVFYDSFLPGGGNSNNRGNIKIQLGHLDTDFTRDCNFNLYVCTQDAFADYSDESSVALTEFFMNFNPINVYRNVSYGSNKVILYNYFLYNLDRNYSVDEIKSAIKTGMRLFESNSFIPNSLSSGIDWLKFNDGIYTGYWSDVNAQVKYDNDCWDSSLENIVASTNGKFIIGNCKNNNCSGKIKIRVAFRYVEPNSTNPGVQPLYPTVTFCDAENVVTPNPDLSNWLWSTWPPADFTTDANNAHTFDSPTCPAGSYAASCLTKNYYLQDQNNGNYGEDDIQSIKTDGEKCSVVGKDTKGAEEQRRTVGVLCSPVQPIIKWPSSWDQKTFMSYNYVSSSPSCDPGTVPIACFAEVNNARDMLVDSYIVGNKCNATFHDNNVPTTGPIRMGVFDVKVGVSCMNILGGLQWGSWKQYDSSTFNWCELTADVGIFESTCPSGIPIGCISQVGSDTNYNEDLLQSVYIEGNKCKVYADDFDRNQMLAGCEQRRRVGAICYSQ
ncbi:MAG: hypothetical protein V1678_03090 [Candidatus Aenigmatarchaeota archaeon]